MSTNADYITAIGQLVQGTIPLADVSDADKLLAVDMAIKEHSKHSPLIVVQDISGTGAFDYAIAALTSWSDGFSVIKEIVYPVDDTDPVPAVLGKDEWAIIRKPAGQYLRFLQDEPGTDEAFRVTYTALHTCSALACTINTVNETAVQALAASYFLQMIATYYAQTQDSTVNADSVDHKSKAAEYASRANKYRKIYFDAMGMPSDGARPGLSAVVDAPASGRVRLTH